MVRVPARVSWMVCFGLLFSGGAASQGLEDLDFMTGRWVQDGPDSVAEEWWLPSQGGTKAAVFRWVQSGQVAAIELVIISEEPEGVFLRFKHFDSDYTAWEKAGPNVYELERVVERRAIFRRISENEKVPLRMIYSGGPNRLEFRGTTEGDVAEDGTLSPGREDLVLNFVRAREVAPVAAARAQEAVPPRCENGKRHEDAPPEFSQFEFLVGDFEITSHAWTGAGWSPPRPGPRARWNGWYGLGGMAIYDEWFDPDPGLEPNAPRGVNVRFYDEGASQWQMMWIASGAAQVSDLRAEMREGKLTMWQVYPERSGFLADFTVEDEDRWYRTSYVKNEHGEWAPQFKLAATRIHCP